MPEILPFVELFPHVHPLKPIDVRKNPLLEKLDPIFIKEHRYYLANYLDGTRVEVSMKILGRCAGKGSNMAKAIEKFIRTFDILDVSKTADKIVVKGSEPGAWIIWIFVTSAFVLLNEAIKADNLIPFIPDIEICFKNAHEYKKLWHERKGRYKGADGHAVADRELKAEIYTKWQDIRNQNRKNNTKAAANYLYGDCGYAEKLKYSTLIRYIREWRKSAKNKK